MTERPIIFTAESVEAILAGRKTQTRRKARSADASSAYYPYGKPGDVLWVKESINGRSPLFMPRKAARLFLELTAVRAERLQDISEADAVAEGVASVADYIELWDRINAARGFPWSSNPWVWVLTFEVKK